MLTLVHCLSGGQQNGEYCAVCGAAGLYVCCDGCPRVFHPLCVDPPLLGVEETSDHWFCRECTVAKVRSFAPGPLACSVGRGPDHLRSADAGSSGPASKQPVQQAHPQDGAREPEDLQAAEKPEDGFRSG